MFAHTVPVKASSRPLVLLRMLPILFPARGEALYLLGGRAPFLTQIQMTSLQKYFDHYIRMPYRGRWIVMQRYEEIAFKAPPCFKCVLTVTVHSCFRPLMEGATKRVTTSLSFFFLSLSTYYYTPGSCKSQELFSTCPQKIRTIFPN